MGLSSLIWVMVQRDVKTSTPSLNFYFRTFHYFSRDISTQRFWILIHDRNFHIRTLIHVALNAKFPLVAPLWTYIFIHSHCRKKLFCITKKSRLELWNVLGTLGDVSIKFNIFMFRIFFLGRMGKRSGNVQNDKCRSITRQDTTKFLMTENHFSNFLTTEVERCCDEEEAETTS